MSRKVTTTIVSAFIAGNKMSIKNSSTDGKSLFLHGNKIAEKREDGLYITNAGWSSNVTKERLNALPGVRINQRNLDWYLNENKWDGSWTKVQTN
jgi:hypothetical protein